MNATTHDLNGLAQTAWLTAWCHVVAGSDFALERPTSHWLIDTFGPPPFAPDLSWFTVHGVAQRAALFDDWTRQFVAACAARGERCEIWSIGCGFDARWLAFAPGAGTIARYVELDQADVIARKREWFAASPFADDYAKVDAYGLDLAHDALPAALAADTPVLVVAEGVLDYLPERERLALIAALRARAPRAEFLLDGQNAWSSARNNRRVLRSTGSDAVRFAATPPHPENFYLERCGLAARARLHAVPELMRRKHPWLSRLPRPRRANEAYQLLWLAPARGAAPG
jgi:O-methyltransferase involved in polyketide biosynthesis